MLACRLSVAAQLLAAFALTSLLTYAMLIFDVPARSSARPATTLALCLGLVCGYCGFHAVQLAGGNAWLWLAGWEALCSIHVCSVWFTPQLFLALHGRRAGEEVEPSAGGAPSSCISNSSSSSSAAATLIAGTAGKEDGSLAATLNEREPLKMLAGHSNVSERHITTTTTTMSSSSNGIMVGGGSSIVWGWSTQGARLRRCSLAPSSTASHNPGRNSSSSSTTTSSSSSTSSMRGIRSACISGCMEALQQLRSVARDKWQARRQWDTTQVRVIVTRGWHDAVEVLAPLASPRFRLAAFHCTLLLLLPVATGWLPFMQGFR